MVEEYSGLIGSKTRRSDQAEVVREAAEIGANANCYTRHMRNKQRLCFSRKLRLF
jgi:hypothetical protein